MSTDKIRDEFEEWAVGQGLNLKKIITGVYRTGNTSLAWKAWKESRAALVVALPDTWSPNDCGDWAYWADAVDAAIEAAGVTVK